MDLLCGYFMLSNSELQAFIAHRMLCVFKAQSCSLASLQSFLFKTCARVNITIPENILEILSKINNDNYQDGRTELQLSSWTQHLPRSSSQNLQLPEWRPCAESMEQNGFRDTKDSIPWAMSDKYEAFWNLTGYVPSQHFHAEWH